MQRLWTFLACLIASTALVFADLPFRNHRYDAFKVLDVKSDHIVFIGNSITNMHAWCEAFGNPKVINRGVSGAVSDETIANLEGILRGQPAKAFLMIGTNDLGTNGINNPERVAQKVKHILNRFKKESPQTKLFVQSILPSKSGIRTLEAEQATNALIKELCSEMGATYIDLWDLMMPITTGQTFSLDGLHPNAAGYRAWCNAIAPYVNGEGATCTYPADAALQYGGPGGSVGMRVSAFGMQKVEADDILMIGDDVMHGGEWHEIFNSAHAKNRGIGRGYSSISIADLTKAIDVIFKGRKDNVAPAQVCLYIGARDANGNTGISELTQQYRTLLEKVNAAAPNATIHVLSLMPTNDATRNNNRVVPFNNALKTMVGELGFANKVKFVDCYAPMANGSVANTAYFNASHLYGMGYAKLSQIVGASLNEVKAGCVTPLTDDKAKAAKDAFLARTTLGNHIAKAEAIRIGNAAGEYTAEKAAKLSGLITEAYSLLGQTDATNSALNAKAQEFNTVINELLPLINQPLASNDETQHWYKLFTPNRNNLYVTSCGAGNKVAGLPVHNFATGMWKFVSRDNGTYDIVNRADNSFLAMTSPISTTAEKPAEGWKMDYATEPGTFIIVSGQSQLNQSTNNADVLNWGGGENRGDVGCQYALVVAGEPDIPQLPDPLLTLTNLELDGSHLYRIQPQAAAPVLKAQAVTVVIDVTPKELKADVQTLVGSSNEDGEDFFTFMTRETSKLGVQYMGAEKEGWFTGAANLQGRTQLMVVMDDATDKYAIYQNGKLVKEVDVSGANFNTSYPFHRFGNVEGVTGLFVGGIKLNGEKAIRYPFTGTIHSVRFYGKALTAAELGQLTFDNLTGDEAAKLEDAETERPAEKTMIIDMTTGEFDPRDSDWRSNWTSYDKAPEVTLNSGANNMRAEGNDIAAASGTSQSANYTLRVPVGYAITSFSFDFTALNPNNPETVSYKGKDLKAKAEKQTLSDKGLNTEEVVFTIKGPNTQVLLQNFVLTVKKTNEQPEPQFNVFVTPNTSAIPYRIPAIATAANGDLIAVADYRHSRGDIGTGRIDLHGRISKDNGQTWGDVFTIVNGTDYDEGNLKKGYGDPCIVADRESNRVLLISCSGDIMFPSGTRDHHQGIARFYSEDNGQTWGKPVDISESIYKQFDGSKSGGVRSMFIGSGRIFQSATVKVGNYYRLYCANLLKDTAGANKNFVLYSDDFGDTWHVLGGTDVAPIPGGDEPKAEELPDGSVVISSRKTNGRYFNIFQFTDTEKAEGSRGNVISSDGSNNGCAATSNSCNGEIMVLPAVRRADNREVFIVLQSIPMAQNRSRVSIAYKELESLTDYATTTDLAKDWDGVKLVSKRGSAYSTMSLLQNHTIGFLYEEETFCGAGGGGYTIVYKNYSLEQITDSAYSFKADASALDNVKAGMPARLDAVKALVGKYVGNLKEESVADVEKAHDAFIAAPSKALYEAFNLAISQADRIELNHAIAYRLRNSNRENGTLYLVANATGLTAAVLNENSDNQLFAFVPTDEEGVWKVKNAKTERYIGSTGKVETEIPVVNSMAKAAPYSVVSDANGLSYLACTTPENASYPAIHLAGDNTRLVPWVAQGSPASHWYIEPTDIATAIESLPVVEEETPEVFYDLAGRRVTKLVKGGVYVTNRNRKFIMR